MRKVNPAITWREWLIAPAYQQAAEGNADLVKELQELFSRPYDRPEHRLRRPTTNANQDTSSMPVVCPTTAVPHKSD